jgi:hypothetical protein
LSTEPSLDSTEAGSNFTMSTMGHNSVDNGEYHYDLDQWTCPSCFKTLSSSRHPIYNENICSCADLGWCTKETTESNYRYGSQNHTSNLGGSLPCDGKIRSCKTTCAMDLDPTYRFTSHHYIRALSYLWAEPTDRIRRTYALLDNCSYGVANGSRSDKERERRQKLYGQEGPLTAEQLAKQLRKQVTHLILAIVIAPEKLIKCTALQNPVRRS